MNYLLLMKAILLDVMDTLLTADKRLDFIKISEYLQSKGYNIYYQSIQSAYRYVIFIKFMKIPINSYTELFKLIFKTMEIKVDEKTLNGLVNIVKKTYHLKLLDDVIDFLEAIKDKYLIALVSTIPKFIFEEGLGESRKYFKEIVTGWDAKASKPDPKIYLTALKKLGVKPEEAVYIGDDVNLDIIPPKKLGMKTIYINRKGLTCKEADYSVKSLRDCIKII